MIHPVLCALLLLPLLAPGPAGAVSIGISFSSTGTYDTTIKYPAAGTLVKAYVIARDVPVQGITGWEGSILVNGPVEGPVFFAHPSWPSAINVLNAPNFQVGFTSPLMPDASGKAILQTISFYYLSGTIYLGLAPSIPSSMNPRGDCRWGTAPCYELTGESGTIRPFALRSAGAWTDTAYGFDYVCGTGYGPPRGVTCASVSGSPYRNRIVAIVEDKDTGLPLPGAAVGLYDWGLRRQAGTTNAIGQCLFSAGDGISHFYAAEASCQGQQAWAVIGFRGQYETVCTLTPSMQPVVSGTVKDDFNQSRIGGARIQLWLDSSTVAPVDSALTESDGSYRIANPGLGSYHLVAYKQGPLGDVPQARLYRRSAGSSFTIDSSAGIYPSHDFALSSNVVVLVHGLMSSAAAWNNTSCNYPATIRAHGWAVLDNVTLPGEVGGTHGWARIKEQADTLSARIVETGVKSVNVVAHSQGGLVTRWANEHLCPQGQPMVNRLICLATPHHGSPLAKIPGAIYSYAKAALVEEAPQWLNAAPEWVVGQLRPLMPAFDDLAPNSNFMKELNQRSLADDWSGNCTFGNPSTEQWLAAKTSYATIRATTYWGKYVIVGDLMRALYGCFVNDGFVPSESAQIHASGSNVHNYIADDTVHHKSWWSPPGILESQDVMDQVVTLLSGSPTAWPEAQKQAIVRDKVEDDSPLCMVASRDFLVPSGASGVDSLYIDPADSLTVFWSWRAGQVNMTLISPAGTVVDSAYVATHAGWERGLDAAGMTGFYKWAAPAPGTWRLRASSRPGDAEQVVSIVATANRAVSLVASVGEPVSELFGDRLVTATLQSPDGQRITGASVWAGWLTPSGATGSTVLEDDGVAPDIAAGDGVYSASLAVEPEYGHTSVTISADGQSPYAFHRNVGTGFTEEREATIAVLPTGLRLESHNSLVMSPVTLRADVGNGGASEASVMLRWTLGDSLMIAESRGTIPAGGSAEFSASHLPLVAGTYRYSVAVVPVGSCADDDSGDNAATAAVTIGAAITGVEDGGGGQDGEDDGGPATPRQGAIVSASPNPFNPLITITVTQKAHGQVRLDLFDVRGRLVRRLFSGELSAGPSIVTWDGRDDEGRALPTGSYVIHLRGTGVEDAMKVLLLK